MKQEYFFEPRGRKVVHQLPWGITFAYNIGLDPRRDYWKGLTEDKYMKN